MQALDDAIENRRIVPAAIDNMSAGAQVEDLSAHLILQIDATGLDNMKARWVIVPDAEGFGFLSGKGGDLLFFDKVGLWHNAENKCHSK